MTREEAIEILEECWRYSETYKYTDAEIRESLDMAIKALEQEPCEDCISRAEALKHSHIEYDNDGEGYRVVYFEDIENLPSVTPTSDAEGDYESGYNCGYADAMNDIAESGLGG